MEKKILKWFATKNTGVSSKAMAFAAVGIENKGNFANCTPSDPADFNRCLVLIDSVPEIKEKFSDIAKLSQEWAVVISRWDELEKIFIDEVGFDWSKEGSATKTYELMKEIGL